MQRLAIISNRLSPRLTDMEMVTRMGPGRDNANFIVRNQSLSIQKMTERIAKSKLIDEGYGSFPVEGSTDINASSPDLGRNM